MQTITEIALQKAERGVFTRDQAALWVKNRTARLDALLKRAVASGEVWRIHRGLYCLSIRHTPRPTNPFELAQRIHGPSYISLETALAWHGWIPEAVHAITSVSLQRSRTFDTPLGLFSFAHIPQRLFFAEVTRVSEEGGGNFLLATPLKALADYVYIHRSNWKSVTPVVESLRIDEKAFDELTSETFDRLMPLYRADRVRRFLGGFRKDLKR